MFTLVLSNVITGEKITKINVLSILCSVTGIVLISNPQLGYYMLGQVPLENHQSQKDLKEYPYFTVGVFVALFSSFCSASGYISLRRLGESEGHPTLGPIYCGLYTAFAAVLAQAVLSIFFPNKLTFLQGPPPFKIYHSAQGTLMLILIGLFGCFS